MDIEFNQNFDPTRSSRRLRKIRKNASNSNNNIYAEEAPGIGDSRNNAAAEAITVDRDSYKGTMSEFRIHVCGFQLDDQSFGSEYPVAACFDNTVPKPHFGKIVFTQTTISFKKKSSFFFF